MKKPTTDEALMGLYETITPEQRGYILVLLDECKTLGATNKQLAPIYAGILVDRNPSPETIEKARKWIEENHPEWMKEK